MNPLDGQPAPENPLRTPFRGSIYDEGGNAIVMLLQVLCSFGLGWALLLTASDAGVPFTRSIMSNTVLAHGIALLLGSIAIQAARTTRIGGLVEQNLRKLVYKVLWKVGEAPRVR